MFGKTLAMGLVLAGALATGVTFAQENAGAAAGGGGGGRGGRGGNMADFRAQMEQRMKESLGVSEDEWKVLKPRVEKVTNLQRDMRSGSFGRRGGPGGGGDRQPSDVEQKAEALRTALDNKESKADDIAAKVKDLRAAREKAKTDLAKAQAELRELVTPKQEAYLVLLGALD